MRNQVFLIASTLLSVAPTAQAKDIREDPFAYEEREAERRRERDEARESAPTQSFGNSGDFALSVERLVGYAHTSRVLEQTGKDLHTDVDRIHGFINAGGEVFGFSTPRIAFDFFATTGLSLGGSVGYGQNMGGEVQRVIVASPRIGYALMFGRVAGIWPRAGATYQLITTNDADAWLLGGTFELPLVLVAGRNAAFVLGPRLDASFVGKYDPDVGVKSNLSALEYGVSAGVSLFF